MKTILVVDDEIMNQEVIKKILNKEGYSILTADNGQDAIDRVKENKIDLVLMDLMMPVMDGFEAIEIITKTNIVPIIVMSALDDNKTYNKVLELGAIDFITKPFELKRVVQSIKAAIK